MANVRIKDLSTTASTTASDDFFGVDGATNGTRKLNAYSPTFGGNLTVSGTGTFSSTLKSSAALTQLQLASTAGTGLSSANLVEFLDSGGTRQAYIYKEGGSGKFVIGNDQSAKSIALAVNGDQLTVTSTATTLAGNLTVSGGTVTSGSGTLTLNSSANTVVLQSAGTTALTLDSSQTASFSRGGSPTYQTSNTVRVNGGAIGALEVNANSGSGLIQFASGSTYQGNFIAVDAGATLRLAAGTGMALLLCAADSSTKGVKIDTNGNFLMYNSASVPGSNPSGGGYLYVEAGALKYRGSSGTVTTIANA